MPKAVKVWEAADDYAVVSMMTNTRAENKDETMTESSKAARCPRLVIHQSNSPRNQSSFAPSLFAEDVRAGLTAQPKTLPPKYFYDALGSQLFEAICLLPEYYPTRAEAEIFDHYAAEIVRQLPSPIGVIELGSGSSIKTRLLIEAILARQDELHYQPMDISASILELSAEALLGNFDRLRITGHVGDYTRGLGEIERQAGQRLLALFLGSNIGNYTIAEARDLLQTIRKTLQPGDGLLLGADLKKSVQVLIPAYSDALGVTAAFNLNLLARINRELDADFDLSQFQHRALYNEDRGRVEAHLVSHSAQTIHIRALELQIEFQPGETIHTENSYKYDLPQLASLAEETGFNPARTWFDQQKQFSCNFWQAI
ncbi:MAG: L-histidine N(alpha)-methyltransferase [Blastocatellia bacterium]